MIIEDQERPEDRAQLKKLFRVKNTLASMITKRGYGPVDDLRESESFEEFLIRHRSQQHNYLQSLLFVNLNNNDLKLMVTFEFDQGVENSKGKKTALLTEDKVKQIIDRMKSYRLQGLIIIVQGDVTQPSIVDKKARALIDEINSMHSYSCQMMNFDDLVFDITKHQLVSQHIPISEQEKKEVLARYGVTDAQLPRILLSDPVAKFLGLKHGNVVKIVRDSETAGKYITYRIAV